MGRSSYPGQFDTDVELPRVDNNVTDIGAEAINALRDAIFSIEDAIGVNPQGNMDDLVTRINNVIDENGNIQTAALAAKGLVTLPITNSQIDIHAAIEERKLDLDYPTSTLYGILQSAQTDIDAIRTSFNAFSARTTKHFLGTGDRHDGYHIDLETAIMSKTNVESALHELSNAFAIHTTDFTVVAHPAANISLVNDFYSIDSTNVQNAIEQLDVVFSGMIETHQDTLHASGIGINTRATDAYQANTAESVLGSTIFKTETSKATNILQVMRPNVARITSQNIHLRELNASSAYMLRVWAGGVSRPYLDINLSAIIPTDDIDDVVEAINTMAHGCSHHYPISAYNTGGQLTIAHNIPGAQYTIQISDAVSFSAAAALGFGAAVNTQVSWSGEEHAGYVQGHRIKDLKSLIKVHYNHVQRPSNRISLGLGDLSQYGLTVGNEGRVIVNITNHSEEPDDNGTHYIVTFLDYETFILSSDLTLGECDVEIAADSVNFENSANGEIYDIFVENAGDGYGIVTKQSRVSYGPIAGISMRAVGKDFPTNNVEWQVDDNNYVSIYEDGVQGIPVLIPTGYLGSLEVFGPDNVNKAIVELTSTPSVLKTSVTVNQFNHDDKLYLSSVHYGGNFGIRTLKYVTDKRLLGSSLENFSEDALSPLPIDDALEELRNNGVFRGFDVVSYGTNWFTLRGGKALVNGKIISAPTQTLTITDLSSQTRLLLLDKYGNIMMKNDYESGYTMDELTEGDSYGDNRGVVPLLTFETDGTKLDGYFYDKRLMIGKIDKKLFDTTNTLTTQLSQLQNTMGGVYWANAIATYDGYDGYVARIGPSKQQRLGYINNDGNVLLNENAYGFLVPSTPTTHKFELTSIPSKVDTYYKNAQNNIVSKQDDYLQMNNKARHIVYVPGMTHINLYVSVKYYGNGGGPFGVSGTVNIDIGAAITTGMTTRTTTEAYAVAKTLTYGVLPSNTVTENYVVSIPISSFNLTKNCLFDIIPRIKIENSTSVDGGPGDDVEPMLEFNYIRVVTSSYSIAGYINNLDRPGEPMVATVGEIL